MASLNPKPIQNPNVRNYRKNLAIWVLRIEIYAFVLIYSSFDELSRKILERPAALQITKIIGRPQGAAPTESEKGHAENQVGV